MLWFQRRSRLAQCGVIALAILVACSADRPASAPVSTIRARAEGSSDLDVGLKLVPFAARKIIPKLPGELGEKAEKAEKYWDRLEFLIDTMEKYERCVAQGKDEWGCAAQDVFWPGVCYFWVEALGSLSPGWDLFMPALEPVCLGGARLKCCRYNDIEQYPNCHTAFNTRAPINCEGNPYGGVTFGPCLDTNRFEGDIGCLCNYLPDCPIGGAVVDVAGAREWRFNRLAVSIANRGELERRRGPRRVRGVRGRRRTSG